VVSFAAPVRLLLLLLPAAAAVLAVARHRRRAAQQRRLAAPAVWLRVLGGTPATGLVRMLAWCAAAAAIVIAVARPQWGERPTEESIRTRDVVVALDVSDSMLCEDARPSRLGRGIETLVRLLPQLEGNRLAVVVFAGEAYPLVPLTTDLAAVSVFLDGVGSGMVALPGSNLERAVDAALELLPEEGEGRVLMLLTDGENLQGDVRAATARLSEAGVGLLGVVAGSEQGGPIPERGEDGSVHYKRDRNGQPVITRAHPEVVSGIADEVAGEVVLLNDSDPVQQIATAVERLRTREVATTEKTRRIERFPIFLAVAVALVVMGFALSPWRRLAAAVMVALSVTAGPAFAQAVTAPTPATATGQAAARDEPTLTPAPWWQRLVPGGSRRLARSGVGHWNSGEMQQATGDFAGALELDSESAERRYDLGTALAAEGRLEMADPLLGQAAEGGVRDAAFNAGTAALEQSQLQSAVKWLRRAVLADADDFEAKYNYEMALKLLQEQQQQQQQQQQDQSSDDEGQQEPQPESGEGEQPTPTPSAAQGAAPTPTPDPNQALFAALERAEAEAREALRSPTPGAAAVEKDW
jgi:Ca-activated chloride channel family protein